MDQLIEVMESTYIYIYIYIYINIYIYIYIEFQSYINTCELSSELEILQGKTFITYSLLSEVSGCLKKSHSLSWGNFLEVFIVN